METEVRRPIRVLHILHSMDRGGAENAIMNYYRAINRNEVQFDFLLTAEPKCAFEDEIIALGGQIHRVPAITVRHPFPYIKGIRRFFREHHEYKIIHSHTSSKSVIPLAIAKNCGVPVRIAHSHNSQSESGIRGLIRNFLMPFLKITANAYFACGWQAADWLYGKGFTKNGRVQVIRNVIDAQKFRFSQTSRMNIRKKLGFEDASFVVGHVARFCQEKNHRFSIDILKELVNIVPNSYLLLVGDGPLRKDLEDYAKESGVDSRVRFAGVVSNVHDYEQAMDAFILPSFYEGLPLSIIEAQVSGLPCFTTKGSVSDECSVTNLVTYLPLEDGPAAWAHKIAETRDTERKDTFEEIVAAGYDSLTAATYLQNKYINLYNKSL